MPRSSEVKLREARRWGKGRERRKAKSFPLPCKPLTFPSPCSRLPLATLSGCTHNCISQYLSLLVIHIPVRHSLLSWCWSDAVLSCFTHFKHQNHINNSTRQAIYFHFDFFYPLLLAIIYMAIGSYRKNQL